jgi:hypothetical protein
VFWLAVLAALIPVVYGVAELPPKKLRTVVLGGVKQVPYSKEGDPAGAGAGEKTLKTRPLLVDGRLSEWTTGEAHDVTDRSFVVRRALRINDALPEDGRTGDSGRKVRWVWQRGPWLLVDRLTGRVTPLKLPDYAPEMSHVAWFRDYAAYCGMTASGKSLYAVVAQIGSRKPVLARKIRPYSPGTDANSRDSQVCGAPEWQREPLRISFHLSTSDPPLSFDLVGGSAVLVEGGEDDSDVAGKPSPLPPA